MHCTRAVARGRGQVPLQFDQSRRRLSPWQQRLEPLSGANPSRDDAVQARLVAPAPRRRSSSPCRNSRCTSDASTASSRTAEQYHQQRRSDNVDFEDAPASAHVERLAQEDFDQAHAAPLRCPGPTFAAAWCSGLRRVLDAFEASAPGAWSALIAASSMRSSASRRSSAAPLLSSPMPTAGSIARSACRRAGRWSPRHTLSPPTRADAL